MHAIRTLNAEKAWVKRQRKRAVWLFLLPLLLVGMVPLVAGKSYDRWKLSQLFGNEMAAIMSQPDQVTVYRLDHRGEHPGEGPIEIPREGRQPIHPSSEWIDQLHLVLASPGWRGYLHDFLACGPRAAIAVRYQRGKKLADLLICFRCGEVSVAPPGALDWRAFPIVRLRRLMQELYPDFSP